VKHTPLWSLVLVSAFLASALSAFATAEVGQPAPELVVQELSGQTFDPAAQHGKVVVVNFWATWYPPCRREMPMLDAFYREYRARGLEMLGLSLDRSRDATEVHKVMQAFSYSAAILGDAKVNNFGTPDPLPVTFVVDGKGIVRAKLTPEEAPVTEKKLAALVVPLLDGKAARQPPLGSGNSERNYAPQ
jgi:thiol-disulfide isomerase/thioredoxin